MALERAHPEHPGFANGPYRERFIERYTFCRQYIQGKVVLDVPCGVGWGTNILSEDCKGLFGVDIDKSAIEYAKKRYEGRLPGFFYCGDMGNLEMFRDETFDVLLCLDGFEHVPEDVGERFLIEARRILKWAGRLIMTVPVIFPEGRHSGNPFHVKEYPEAELLDIFTRWGRIELLELTKSPDCWIYRVIMLNV